MLTPGFWKNILDGVFWSLLRQGTPQRWDVSDLPWHWSFLMTLFKKCEAVINDWTLRDEDNHLPPKDIWLSDDDLDEYRKHIEERKKQ